LYRKDESRFTLDFFIDFIGCKILPEHRQNGFFSLKRKAEFAHDFFDIVRIVQSQYFLSVVMFLANAIYPTDGANSKY
jgi:hypothetical protein